MILCIIKNQVNNSNNEVNIEVIDEVALETANEEEVRVSPN